MNILPLIFGCIILFSFLTLGFLREHTHAIHSETSLTGYHNASRAVVNKMAQMQYFKLKRKPYKRSKTQKSNKKKNAPSGFEWHREVFPAPDAAKFNLLPLFELQTDPRTHPLYEIAAESLRLLYNDVLFKPSSKEDVEYKLIDAMIAIYKDKREAHALLDLYPNDSTLRPLFYKMLKGTNRYDLAQSQGIAPLEDYFYLGKNAPAIDFACASKTLLQALLGEKNTLKIFSEEKKKYMATHKKASVTQEELASMLTSDPAHNGIVLQLGQMIHFSQKFPARKTVTGQDGASGLVVRGKQE